VYDDITACFFKEHNMTCGWLPHLSSLDNLPIHITRLSKGKKKNNAKRYVAGCVDSKFLRWMFKT
jgi:hypothetical protein